MIEKPLQQIKDPEMVTVLRHIFTEADGRQKTLLTEIPTAQNVDEKEFKLYDDGVDLFLYTKKDGVLKYIKFT